MHVWSSCIWHIDLWFFVHAVKIARINMGWDRLRVLGEFKWWPLHSAYQYIHKWQRWQRTTISPLVWPHCWLSHLFYPLESSAHCVSNIFLQSPSFLLSLSFNLLRLINVYLIFSFSVDGTPIREFKNSESIGVAFPKNQPMRIYSSLWNADDWATRGGLVKTDWTHAPFTASYRNFNADACVWSNGKSSCASSSPSSPSSSSAWFSQELDSTSQERLKWVQKNYMIYNYCADAKRFPQGLPAECRTS